MKMNQWLSKDDKTGWEEGRGGVTESMRKILGKMDLVAILIVMIDIYTPKHV
jgi:hypothetical protein